jgi:uncharacterized protein (DUF885 family)
MKKLLFIAALAATIAACNNNATHTNKADGTKSVEKNGAEATGGDPSVSAVFQRYYEEKMRYFPFEATSNGLSTYNDQFPIDISDSYRDSLKSFFQKYKAQLTAIDASKLSDRDRTSYDILNWVLTSKTTCCPSISSGEKRSIWDNLVAAKVRNHSKPRLIMTIG